MIVSENSKPEITEFQKLMQKTDTFLNNEAKGREKYFQKRTAQLLEEDVCNALKDCSKGTKFLKTQFSLCQEHSFRILLPQIIMELK